MTVGTIGTVGTALLRFLKSGTDEFGTVGTMGQWDSGDGAMRVGIMDTFGGRSFEEGGSWESSSPGRAKASPYRSIARGNGESKGTVKSAEMIPL